MQKSLQDEINKMKQVFKNVEEEGKQITIDLQYSEIARKNVSIMNDALIAQCIAQDAFYTATDASLTAYKFHDMSIALNVFQNRVVELEGENLKLQRKIQNDDHDNMVGNFSNLATNNLNMQLKLQAHCDTIQKLRAQIAQLKSNKSNLVEPQKPQGLDSQTFQLQNIIQHLK